MQKQELKRKMIKASQEEAGCARDGLETQNEKKTSRTGKKSPSCREKKEVLVHLTIPEQTDLVLEALAESPDPGFVLCAGVPHRVLQIEDRTVLQAHKRETLRGHVARRVNFVRLGKQDLRIPTDPPRSVIDDILALPSYPAGIPSLDSIKHTPLLTDDGELIATSGLHPEHRVFLALDPSLEGMSLPTEITEEDMEKAVEVISDPFVDFPLDADSGANLLGLLFAMVFRECIDGLTPLFIVDANRASTGKGMLTSVLSTIAYGSVAPFGSGNVGSEELRKRLFALASQGTRFHVLDNVERSVLSPELSAFLTADRREDRKLGTSETQSFPKQMIIALTGNHIRLGGDIARRTVLIRLHNEHDCPEERSGFKHDPLIPYVLHRRSDILRAMYTVAAAWHRGGRRIPQDTPRMGSFQEWANFSSGILDTLGCTGLLDNWDQVRKRDTDAEEYALMLLRGRQRFGDRAFTAYELLGALGPEEVPCWVAQKSGGSPSKSMGRLLIRIEDRVFGEDRLAIRASGKQDHIRRYRIESRRDRDETATTDSGPTEEGTE